MKTEGLRVVRGPDWKWGDQDGGEGSVGTVVGLKNNDAVGLFSKQLLPDVDRLSLLSQRMSGLVKVVWDCGIQADYRAGFQGFYDLLIVDDAAGGVKHQNTHCHLCDVKEIIGMRWECAECKSNFCCSCFYQIDNRHDHFNAFKRYDGVAPNSEPLMVFVNKPEKKRLHLRGIFPGAKVRRGNHWNYGDEDGEQLGEVMPTPSSTLNEGKVDVKWGSSDKTVTYRRGHQGKMELKAVEAATGGRYHPEWLPILKVITEEESTRILVNYFSVGDRVQIVATVMELREKQTAHGGWIESMNKAFGEAGTVLKVDHDGDILVNFEKLDQKWCLNPTVVKKLTKFSIGQIVRVRDDIDTMKAMRIHLGSDGNKVIFSMAGETGRITKVGMEENGGERVHLELIKSSFKPLPAMKPEWLEAVQVAVKLHEKLSKLKSQLGNLLVQAAQEGDWYLLQELIENHKVSVDVDHKSTPGLTALHTACRQGRLKVIELLLDQGADLEKSDEKGRTALYHAVKGGEDEVLRLLIKKGADLDIMTNKRGLTALRKAIAKRHTQCAEILIDNGCDVNLQDENGDTSLHDVVYMMRNAMVADGGPTLFDTLIKSGRVKLDIRNKKGLSVFHVAVEVGNLRVVQHFLDLENAAEFVLEVIPKKRLNPLHIACLIGHFKTAEKLLDYVKKMDKDSMGEGNLESFVNARDQDDQTPLMIASFESHYSLIELLVHTGVHVNMRDKENDTAISLMIKMSKSKSSPIPNIEKSPEIYQIYKALYDTSHFTETMKKHPLLAAACYLVSKGADPKEALSQSSDTILNRVLKSFVPSNSQKFSHTEGTNCFICGRSSSLLLYECCSGNSSIFCSDCRLNIKICPCCEERIQRQLPSANVPPYRKELCSSPPETYINNFPSYPLEMNHEDDQSVSDAASTSLSTSSKRPPLSTAPIERVITESQSTSGPDIEMTRSEFILPMNSFCNDANSYEEGRQLLSSTPSCSGQHLPASEQSEWTLKPKGSRKNTDLLLDKDGNTFTKRSPNIWQCTKKSDIQKNKCPALVKEKAGRDGVIRYEILKAEHKHADAAVNCKLYVQPQPSN